APTLAVPPEVPTFSSVLVTTLTVSWSSGTLGGGYNPPGTVYLAQLSTEPGFSTLTASSQTANLSAAFAGVSGNATYYAQVESVNSTGTATVFVGAGLAL